MQAICGAKARSILNRLATGHATRRGELMQSHGEAAATCTACGAALCQALRGVYPTIGRRVDRRLLGWTVMRTVYHQQLESLTVGIAELCGLAGQAMQCATQSLLQADLALAEQVITDHDRIAGLITRAGRRPVRPAGPAGPGRRRSAAGGHRHPDRRRRGPDGRAGPARGQGRPPPPPR